MRSGSSTDPGVASRAVLLPDAAGFGRHHLLPGFAAVSFRELGHVYENAVGAKAIRRVRIGGGDKALELRAPLRAPVLREAEEELLQRGEPFSRFLVEVGALLRLARDEGDVGKTQATIVGGVLP
jgi:hypothetical protein